MSGARSTSSSPAGRFALFAKVGAALAQDLAPEQMLRHVALAIVPAFAVWCVVDPRTPSHDDLPVVTSHEDPRSDRVLAVAARTLARGERFVLGADRAFDEMRVVEAAPEHGAESLGVAGNGATHVISAPLVSRGNLLGVISFGRRQQDADSLAIAQDLAGRVALAVDLAHAEAQNDRLRVSRDDMLSILAHGMRTPLSTIAMVTARLRRMPRVIDSARPELDVLNRTIVRLESLLRNVVDCSRLESKRLRLDIRPCSIVGVLSEAVTSAQSAEPRRVITLELPQDVRETDLEVFADAGRVRQVVDCLLSNAIKFGGDSGAVLIRAGRSSGEVIVSISDNGFGIAASRLEKIFVPSWAIDPSERIGSAGPQMGLYLSRGLVEAQGGRLWVESSPGYGSTFSFSLPCTSDAPSQDLASVLAET